MNLDGLNAVVTGCTGGIGSAISRLLAEAGASVVGVDIAREDGVARWKQANPGASYHHVDVTSGKDWEALAKAIAAEHGRLDILVHNAGVVVVKTLEDTTLEDWRFMMGVNVEALYLGTRALLPMLRKGGEARRHGAALITISSTAGYIGAPLHIGYCTSKGAARLFAKACAMEFSALKANIRSVSVHPGGTDTNMVHHIMDSFAGAGFAESAAEAQAGIEADVPMGRLAQPEDIAKVVRFLASDDAGFMHGSEILVEGGALAK